MSGFILFALMALVFVVIYQIARAAEYAAVLRGEERVQAGTNRTIAWLFLATFIIGLYAIYECHEALKGKMLPVSASIEGDQYDFMFEITLIVTGVVFLITQALLFWFAFRYQSTEKRTSFYFPHNNKLELIWTTIPAIVMAILVAIGLRNWFNITSQAPADSQIVEVIGKQFNWIIRYPGKDGEMGKRNYRLINNENNVLGMDSKDPKNADDIVLENGEIHVQVGKPIKLIIGSRDVIHDVGLPHFRFKMDAVPGITTTLWFTPKYTSDQMKEMTGNPNFVYELACDQMCGKGHYSMRGTVIVETRAQHEAWLASQKPYMQAGPMAKPGESTTDSTGNGAGGQQAAGAAAKTMTKN
jgi:cytochrome c oxidase subunit 2